VEDNEFFLYASSTLWMLAHLRVKDSCVSSLTLYGVDSLDFVLQIFYDSIGTGRFGFKM